MNGIGQSILSERVASYAITLASQVAQDEECSLHHIRDRIALVGMAAVLAVTNTFDTLLGHVELLVELVTLGRVQLEDADTSKKRYCRMFQIVRQPFACLMSALHPKAVFACRGVRNVANLHRVGFNGDRIVSGFVSGMGVPLFAKEQEKRCTSSSFFKRQVVSRAAGFGFCLVLLVGRVMEFASGILFAIAAICLQRCRNQESAEGIYAQAYTQLAPAIFFDLVVGLTSIIAPRRLDAVLRRCGVVDCRTIFDDADEAIVFVGEAVGRVQEEEELHLELYR